MTSYITPEGAPTAGPADPNAPTRVKGYTVLTALLGLIPVLTVFKVLTTDQGVAIGQFVQSGIGLAGAFGFAFVAAKTNKQVKNGTFEPAPNLPALTVFEQLGAIQAEVDSTVAKVQSQVGSAVSTIQGAAALIPGGSAITGAIMSGPVGDLIGWATDNPPKAPGA